MTPRSAVAVAGALATGVAVPRTAAVCGVYVAGGDTELYDHATVVTMTREGGTSPRFAPGRLHARCGADALGADLVVSGCGCRSGDASGGWSAMVIAVALAWRRRRTR